MQFDENPYLYTEEAAPPEQQTAQQLYQQPAQQQPYQQSYPYQPYQQPYQQQNYQQPYQQNYQQPYQQQPYQQPYQPYPQQRYYGAQPNKASGMAKAFTIVSFVTGILSLFSAMSGMISLFISLTGTSSLLSPPDEGSLRLAAEAMAKARELLADESVDVLILDELCNAVYFELITEEDALSLLDAKRADQELVLTGRNATEKLIERADLVTEMREIKHPFKQGIKARKGIEY